MNHVRSFIVYTTEVLDTDHDQSHLVQCMGDFSIGGSSGIQMAAPKYEFESCVLDVTTMGVVENISNPSVHVVILEYFLDL